MQDVGCYQQTIHVRTLSRDSNRGVNLLDKVSDLINTVNGQWDEQLVQDYFCPENARLILQIPLRDGAEDFIAWHFDEKGQHSVK